MQKQPFAADDLYLFEQVEGIATSPRHDGVTFVLKTVDRDADDYKTALHFVSLDGDEPRAMTRAEGTDRSVDYAPDGKSFLYISNDPGSPQVFVMRSDGGEARQVTHFDGGVVGAHFAPDGRSLVATARIAVDSRARGARGAKPPGEHAVEVAWRLPYKMDGTGFTLGREIHAFLVDLDTGRTKQITDGAFDVKGIRASPDGKHIAYCRSRTGRQAHRTDLYVCHADGTNHRQLTRDIASTQLPVWSPDSRRIAFTGSKDEGDSMITLWIAELESGRVHEVADADTLEVASGEMVHWADAAHLYVAAARRGCQHVVRIAAEGGEPQAIVEGERHVLKFMPSATRLVYVAASIDRPNQIYSCKPDGSDERQHTRFNAWWDERLIPTVTKRSFRVPDGDGGEEAIEAWVAIPEGGATRRPLLVDAHGGPQSYVLLNCPGKIYWYLLAGHDWVVVAPNAVGSSSYGRAFARRLRGQWGERDLAQYLAVIEALKTEGVASDEVAMTGKSYGGYLTAWAVTQTETFRAAIVSAPVSNLESHFGTSDTGYYVSPYAMKGDPTLDRDTARRLSPVQHLGHTRTPTLLLQGKDDHRCPLGQSEEFFAALVREGGVDCELVMYPGGDHHLAEEGRPSHRKDYFTRLAKWARRYAEDEVAEPQRRSA